MSTRVVGNKREFCNLLTWTNIDFTNNYSGKVQTFDEII